MITYIGLLLLHQNAFDVIGTLDGWTYRVKAQLGIGFGALGVVDPGYDVRDLEDVFGDLRGHDVSVVALRHGNEAVGVFDACPAKDVSVGPIAHHLIAPKFTGQDAA
jgi:hypothetical protein